MILKVDVDSIVGWAGLSNINRIIIFRVGLFSEI